MAHTPLYPDEVVLDPLAGLPVLQAHVEDGPHARFAVQPGCELGDGLNDVDLCCDTVEEKPFGNAANAENRCQFVKQGLQIGMNFNP